MKSKQQEPEKKQVFQTGAMNSVCEWCQNRKRCQFKTHPISGAPCIKCSDFIRDDHTRNN